MEAREQRGSMQETGLDTTNEGGKARNLRADSGTRLSSYGT